MLLCHKTHTDTGTADPGSVVKAYVACVQKFTQHTGFLCGIPVSDKHYAKLSKSTAMISAAQ